MVAPTTSLPLIPILALFWEKSGIARDHALRMLREAITEAMQNGNTKPSKLWRKVGKAPAISSFEALATGLQDALHFAGGVPRRVRSDSLSAAVKNLSSEKEFTARYQSLLDHYGVRGRRINIRKPHENGDAESSHGHLKSWLDQMLRLRGSRDFATTDEYRSFLRQVVARRNASRTGVFGKECEALERLPLQRVDIFMSLQVTVRPDCILRIKRNVTRSAANTSA